MSAQPWPEHLGSQVPRIRVVPEGVDHPRWQEIVEFVARLGVVLDPWQWDVLRVSLMRTLDGLRWAAFAVAVCCPRQNGKNAILEIRELVGAVLLGEKLLIHSAHLADTSKEAFRRLDDLIDGNDWLSGQVSHVWRTNGHESIEFKGGNRIRFRTRTRGGGRGFSGSPVVFDEAMFLPEVSMGSILPVISAQPDPQVWYMGSAVDQTIHEDGVTFARVRDRALTGDDERLAYLEWSLDFETPDQVELTDPLAQAAETNPALGIRIMPDYLAAERRELDARTLSVERYGVGDWPPVDGSAAHVISIQSWDSLTDDPAAEGARMLDPVCFAIGVKPDRLKSSICAVGRRSDGLAQLEVVDHRDGTGWVAGRLAELTERNETVAVIVDAAGPAGSLVHEIEEAGVKVTVTNTSECAMAFGHMLDAVENREFRHLGSDMLRSAVKGATKRPIGDGAFAWGRRHSLVDITALEAGTLALWGWHTLGWTGEVAIY